MADWSLLPPDVLGLIWDRLRFAQYPSMRRVCRRWHRAYRARMAYKLRTSYYLPGFLTPVAKYVDGRLFSYRILPNERIHGELLFSGGTYLPRGGVNVGCYHEGVDVTWRCKTFPSGCDFELAGRRYKITYAGVGVLYVDANRNTVITRQRVISPAAHRSLC